MTSLPTLLRESRYDEALPELQRGLELYQKQGGRTTEPEDEAHVFAMITILEALMRLIERPRSMESAPRDGTKVFLIFPGLEYAPIASWEILEGDDDDGNGQICTWCFVDDSFGENGDGWLYEDDQQPVGWFPTLPQRPKAGEQE